MKAAILKEAGHFEIMDIPVPEINSNEILIRVLVCGTCMSEYPQWREGQRINEILGHEPVGIIEEVGNNVRGFKSGDRVSGLLQNAFAEYTKADPSLLIKIPDEISDVEGILEPWSCLISGAHRMPMDYGYSFALVGCGYMGLGMLQLMKQAGKTIAVDIRDESLDNARRFGADEVYKPDQVPVKYIVDQWNNEMFIKGVDVVAEAGGGSHTLELAGKMVRPHGTLSIIGFHQSGGRRDIDMGLWNWKAITVINAHERRVPVQMGYFNEAIHLIQAKRLRVKEMITHKYNLEDLNKAFSDLKEKPKGYIKGYIRIAEK